MLVTVKNKIKKAMEFLLQLLAELFNDSTEVEQISDHVSEELELEEVQGAESFFSLMHFH